MSAVLKYTLMKDSVNPFVEVEKFNELVMFVRLLIIPQVILEECFFHSWSKLHQKIHSAAAYWTFHNLGQIMGIVVIITGSFRVRPDHRYRYRDISRIYLPLTHTSTTS